MSTMTNPRKSALMVVPSSTPKAVNHIWKRVNMMATAAASGLRDSLVNIQTSCTE